uniref:Small ribosomal subunit protein uS13 n=1 Tax=Timema shepardi TaxID=629360 RepID=A0A7R9AN67_TIMSH|nr:unnamed protein product [Timema shepardi]
MSRASSALPNVGNGDPTSVSFLSSSPMTSSGEESRGPGSLQYDSNSSALGTGDPNVTVLISSRFQFGLTEELMSIPGSSTTSAASMSSSLVIPEKFQHILRVMGTNIDGKRKVMFAMTAIKGVGRRYANIVLKKADIDLDKRAGECTEEEVEKIITIMSNPRQYKIPDWFLNRQKDIVDGKYSQVKEKGA